MKKKVSILFLITLFFIACQTGKEDLKKFSEDYNRISQELKEKQSKVNTREEFTAFNEEKKKEYGNLLTKYEESPDIEGIEILRSKVLLELEKFDEAAKKIDQVLADKPDSIIEAKMVKVNVLIKEQKYDEAYDIFKDIEAEVKDRDDLYNALFYIALLHSDNEVKRTYSKKFLDAKDLPEERAKNRYLMYFNLAKIATLEGDLDKARDILKRGMADTEEERQKLSLEKQMGQLDFIGKEAIPLHANMWINSEPLTLADLKGKPVVVYFWAPWCPPCRALIPTIVEEYNDKRDKGFVVIGLTRLTGKYEDEELDKGKVSEEEELELIKKYMERKKITFPVVVAKVDDRADLDNYKITGIPTQIFINKQGIVDFITSGSGNISFIKERIKSLLEE